MARSKIEWTQKTWNPFRGCTRVSEGCRNCYAERFAARFGNQEGSPYEGLANFATTKDGKEPRWTNKVRVIDNLLEAPIHWKNPSLVFVNSMSDTFHEAIPDEEIIRLFETMELCNGDYTAPRHHFQVLTKRPERMKDMFVNAEGAPRGLLPTWNSNVWLGVSVEDCETVERIEYLHNCGTRVKWVSAEPLLEDISEAIEPYLWMVDWVVCGGESGPKARPMEEEWAYNLFMKCWERNVKYFFKQMGGRKDKGSKILHRPDGSEVMHAHQFPFGWEFDCG